MRIGVEAYNQIMQVSKPQNTKNVKAAKSTTPSMGKDEVQISSMGRSTKPADKVKAAAKDSVQLSSFGKDIQVAKQAVAEASDIREDKVAEMKAKYSGDVQVDTGDFADKLLAKFAGL